MARYQYKREPLTNENADRLMNACRSGIEKVVISTLLDTGLRVSELAGLTKENVLWQDRRLLVYGKGGPFGKKTKRRIVPLTERAFTVLSNYFSLNDTFGYTGANKHFTHFGRILNSLIQFHRRLFGWSHKQRI